MRGHDPLGQDRRDRCGDAALSPHHASIDALKNGLHTMIEKPISAHKADAERLFAVAKEDPKQVFAGMFQMRVEPRYLKIRQLIVLSPHFNITVEFPLKAIVRGYSWTVMPIIWRNRRSGTSKLKLKEMDSRYLFIVAYGCTYEARRAAGWLPRTG